MSQATCNGFPVLSCELTMGLRGAWSGPVEIDASTAPAVGDAVAIEFAGAVEAFAGTVREVGEWQGRTRLFVVAGGGGLRTRLESRYYYATPARLPIGDILRDAGEALSSTVDATLLDVELASWVRAAGEAGAELEAVVRAIGLGWRALADGTIWIGSETWPLGPEVDVLEEDPAEGTATLSAPAPDARPGQTIDGRRASTVAHVFGEVLRTRVVFEPDEEPEGGRELDLFRRAVRGQVPELPFLLEYSATVIAQASDGTLEVICDDETIGGLANVPIRLGLPGCSVEVEQGARVTIAFVNGLRTGAYAGLWETDAEAVTITIDADAINLGAAAGAVVREEEAVEIYLPGTPDTIVSSGFIRVTSGLGTPPAKSKVLA